MKKLLAIMVLGLLWCNVSFADTFTVIVKNKIDKSIFIKRTKANKKEAIDSALKGCKLSLASYDKKKRKKMQKACYVDSVEKEVIARYPETLFPADDAKKKNWDEFVKSGYSDNVVWPHKIWAEVRSKDNYYSYEWHASMSFEESFRIAMDGCENRRTSGIKQEEYSDSDLCIVMYINGKDTTEQEKSKYSEKYYGEKVETYSSDLINELKELHKLLQDGYLTEEEFTKAKKKLLN